MTERHTSQESEGWLMLLVGTRDVGLDYETDEPRLDPSHRMRRDHNYTYGLSREALRPVGPFPETMAEITGLPRKPHKVKQRKPVKRTTEWARRKQLVVMPTWTEPVQTEPVHTEPVRTASWWLDADVLESRNEDMLQDLLGESQ